MTATPNTAARKDYLLNISKLALSLDADVARLKNAILAEDCGYCDFTVNGIRATLSRYDDARAIIAAPVAENDGGV